MACDKVYMKFHPDDLAEYKDVFNFFDKEKNSLVTVKNLVTTLRCLSPQPKDENIKKVIKQISTDQYATLDFHSFLTAIHNVIEMTKKKSKKITERKESFFTLTPQQLNEVRDAFNEFDQDGNGTLTTEELKSVMESLGQVTTEEELRDMIGSVDTTNSGTIDFPEFVTMMSRKKSRDELSNEAMETFRFFDKDNSGSITKLELKQVMLKFGEKLNEDEIDEMISEADIDGDGEITYNEFLKLMNFPVPPPQ